jgi:acetoin utilization deacetylase AcuC-like enzyme
MDLGGLVESLRDVAHLSAGGRVGVILEGGYDLTALEESVEDTLLGLVDPSSAVRPKTTPQSRSADAVIRAVERAHKGFWTSLR